MIYLELNFEYTDPLKKSFQFKMIKVRHKIPDFHTYVFMTPYIHILITISTTPISYSSDSITIGIVSNQILIMFADREID